MAKFIKNNLWIFIPVIVFGILFAGIGFIESKYIKNAIKQSAIVYEAEIEILKNREGEKIDVLKQNILDRLKRCESGGLELEDSPIILDTNDKMSIGLFMFQIDTVIYYWEKFYGEQITRKTAVEIAISGEARDLAEKIIFEETGGIFNWKNCARKEDLVGEITVIKKLQ